MRTVSSQAAEDRSRLPIMSAVGMRLVCCCLAAWATVSQSSSTGLGNAAGTEESQQPGISSRQSGYAENEVDLSREQKQQKWAFMPHNPSAFGEKVVTNQETGGSASASEDSRNEQSNFTKASLLCDRTNVNRPSQSLNENVDPVTSNIVHTVDDRTLLDVFAESTKEYLTTRLVSGLELESSRFSPHISTLMSSVSLSYAIEDPPI